MACEYFSWCSSIAIGYSQFSFDYLLLYMHYSVNAAYYSDNIEHDPVPMLTIEKTTPRKNHLLLSCRPWFCSKIRPVPSPMLLFKFLRKTWTVSFRLTSNSTFLWGLGELNLRVSCKCVLFNYLSETGCLGLHFFTFCECDIIIFTWTYFYNDTKMTIRSLDSLWEDFNEWW